jgi:hypothetical protein
MPEPAMRDEGDPFYVGYLRMPLRLLRFLAVVLVLLMLADAGLALVLYRLQDARASGDWSEEGEIAVDGIFVARPYPLVLAPGTGGAAGHAVLLVSEGKAGAPPTLAPLDGKRVTARGYALLRDEITVLQLTRDPEAAGETPAVPVRPAPAGALTLTGEIADTKCFIGAMNPGEGKVHKSCASLCILGGIPPLFITRDAAGRPSYRLLADAEGGPINTEAAARAGEFITLTGTVSHLDGIDIFAVPQAALE